MLWVHHPIFAVLISSQVDDSISLFKEISIIKFCSFSDKKNVLLKLFI